jgi:hypothetical protein
MTPLRSRLFFASLVVLALTPTSFGNNKKATAPQRFWHSLLALAGHGEVPIGDLRATAAVVAKLRRSTGIVKAVLAGKVKADKSTREFWDEVTENLQDLDLDSLHDNLPEGPDNEWRSLRLRGRWTGKEYSITRARSKKALKLDVEKKPGAELFEGSLDLSSRPRKKASSYQGTLAVQVGLGSTNASQLGRLSRDIIRLIERESTLDFSSSRARPSKKTRKEINSGHSDLGAEDAELLACFSESFPRLYKVLGPVFELKDIVRRKSFPGVKDSLCEVRFTLSIRSDTLKDKYPEIEEYLDNLGELLHLEGRLKDTQGRSIGSFELDSGTRTMKIRAFIKDGAVIPIDDEGKADFAAALDPDKVRRLNFSIRGKALFNVNGIKLAINRIALAGDYRRVKDDALVRSHFRIAPKVSISGQAYGIIPTWLIDVFIPGNIDELAKSFLKTMTGGNDGRGLEMRSALHTGESGRTAWSLVQKSEFLNNALIQIGFRLMNHKFIPNEDAREELKSFMTEALTAVEKDSALILSTLKK